MSIYQELCNLDEVFANLKTDPIILNNLPIETEEDRLVLDSIIMSKFDSDILTGLPQCQCTYTRGVPRLDEKCVKCGSVVRYLDDVEPLLWFSTPPEVPKILSPTIMDMIMKQISSRSCNILQWLIDPTYEPPKKKPATLLVVETMGFERGYNYFVNNLEDILEEILKNPKFRVSDKRIAGIALLEVIRDNRRNLFSSVIPLPNKTLIISEDTNTGRFISNSSLGSMDLLRYISNIETVGIRRSSNHIEVKVAKAMLMISEHYASLSSSLLTSKEGLLRHHVFGSRMNFSFRCVIGSIPGIHRIDEIHVPWGVGVTCFRPHILNKLLKMGMVYNDALDLIIGSVHKYNKTIDRILRNIIKESRNGIPVIFIRNPTLLAGSIQLIYITKFKIDPGDKVISVSINNAVPFNYDFDGDNMNAMVLTDDVIHDAFINLASVNNVLTLDEPNKISRNVTLTKPIISTISNWVRDGHVGVIGIDREQAYENIPKVL